MNFLATRCKFCKCPNFIGSAPDMQWFCVDGALQQDVRSSCLIVNFGGQRDRLLGLFIGALL